MTTPKSKGKGRKASQKVCVLWLACMHPTPAALRRSGGLLTYCLREKGHTGPHAGEKASTQDAIAALTKPIAFAPLQDLYAPPPPRYGEAARLQEDNDMLRKTIERLTKRLEKLSARAMLPTEENGSEDGIAEMTPEKVNHPAHYNSGGIEVIDVIEAFGLGFNLGNAVKYICRAEHKGNPGEDLDKALWYLTRAVNNRKAGKNP